MVFFDRMVVRGVSYEQPRLARWVRARLSLHKRLCTSGTKSQNGGTD